MGSRFFTAAAVGLAAVMAASVAAPCAAQAPARRQAAAEPARALHVETVREEAPEAPEQAGRDGAEGLDGASSLGQVAWILVIQAVRGPKGELVPWDKDGPWAKAWRVPGDAGGTRFVPVFGDAEDREHVRPAGPRRLDGLSFVAGKYQAPAIAVVVREADAVAVVGWRGGAASGWATAPVPAGAPAEDAKAAALRLVAGVFPSRGRKDPEIAAAERLRARVLAFRDAGESTRQYQIVVEGRGSAASLQRRIESVPGLSISEIMTTPEGGFDIVLDDRSGSPEPVERRLTQAGLPTAADARR